MLRNSHSPMRANLFNLPSRIKSNILYRLLKNYLLHFIIFITSRCSLAAIFSFLLNFFSFQTKTIKERGLYGVNKVTLLAMVGFYPTLTGFRTLSTQPSDDSTRRVFHIITLTSSTPVNDAVIFIWFSHFKYVCIQYFSLHQGQVCTPTKVRDKTIFSFYVGKKREMARSTDCTVTAASKGHVYVNALAADLLASEATGGVAQHSNVEIVHDVP